jgi:hypothetical protein
VATFGLVFDRFECSPLFRCATLRRCQLLRLYSVGCQYIKHEPQALVECHWQGTAEVFGENPVPVPVCRSWALHGLVLDRTQAFALKSRQVISRAMARPSVDRIIDSSHSRLSKCCPWLQVNTGTLPWNQLRQPQTCIIHDRCSYTTSAFETVY